MIGGEAPCAEAKAVAVRRPPDGIAPAQALAVDGSEPERSPEGEGTSGRALVAGAAAAWLGVAAASDEAAAPAAALAPWALRAVTPGVKSPEGADTAITRRPTISSWALPGGMRPTSPCLR